MSRSHQRVAAVTGVTSGIGRATAVELLKQGYWSVVGCGRRAQRLSELEAEAARTDKVFAGLAADVAEPDLVQRLSALAQQRTGLAPTLFVLSAGRGLRGTLLTSDEQAWPQLFETNVLALFGQMRDCARLLLADTSSAEADMPRDIVVIGSTAGRTVSAANPVYGATKFAVHSAVESLRQEVAPSGVRVTLVEPGFVRSEFQEVAAYEQSFMRQVEADCGPLLVPEDVARAIAFAVSQPAHVHIDDIRLRPTRQKV
jgi:NADP-dependent 3-hydroxy acid dehydrogenase YdfG